LLEDCGVQELAHID
jgi:DNA-directed RNA polymerase II subunit RPB2